MSEQLTQTEFQILLAAFNKLIDDQPPVAKVKDELLEIKASALASVELNSRQIDAVVARCNNYINGEYGVSEKKKQFMAEQKKS